MSHVRTYNPSVRVGNWNEDIQLEEDTLKDFLDRREKGELLIQKASNLLQSILKKTDLSISRDGYVHFGDCVMFMNKGAVDRTQYESGKPPRDDSVLSVNVTEASTHESQCILAPCGLSCSRQTAPCVRNSFIVESIDGTPNEAPLRYNQPFHIRTIPDKGGNLYLFSDKVTFQNCSKKARHQEVSLVNEPSFLTQWMIIPFNPLLRMEYESAPVPANEKILIIHCKTNQALCTEEQFHVRTPFGQEYETSCHTYLDSHKAEKDMNHFLITMGVPGDTVYPVSQ